MTFKVNFIFYTEQNDLAQYQESTLCQTPPIVITKFFRMSRRTQWGPSQRHGNGDDNHSREPAAQCGTEGPLERRGRGGGGGGGERSGLRDQRQTLNSKTGDKGERERERERKMSVHDSALTQQIRLRWVPAKWGKDTQVGRCFFSTSSGRLTFHTSHKNQRRKKRTRKTKIQTSIGNGRLRRRRCIQKAFRLSLDTTFVGLFYLLVFCRHCSTPTHEQLMSWSCGSQCVPPHHTQYKHPFGKENYLYTQRKQASKTISSGEGDMKAVITGQKRDL